MKRNAATIISRIFDPFISLAILCTILFYNSAFFVPAFFFMIFVPFLLFLIAWKTKLVGNWDVSDRRERPKILWMLVVLEILASVLLRTTIAVPTLVALIGFAAITQFWKMSGHAMANALLTGVIIQRFGWTWWPVFLIVLIVCWARVVRRDHTIWQVVAGALYSWVLVILFSS